MEFRRAAYATQGTLDAAPADGVVGFGYVVENRVDGMIRGVRWGGKGGPEAFDDIVNRSMDAKASEEGVLGGVEYLVRCEGVAKAACEQFVEEAADGGPDRDGSHGVCGVEGSLLFGEARDNVGFLG